MAIKYLEMPVGEYGTVKVEIKPTDNTAGFEELGVSGFEKLGLKTELEKVTKVTTAEATRAFDTMSNNIHTLAQGFRQSVDQLEEKMRPDEVSVEFGFALKADAGVVVVGLWETSGGVEANFKVSLTWKVKKDESAR